MRNNDKSIAWEGFLGWALIVAGEVNTGVAPSTRLGDGPVHKVRNRPRSEDQARGEQGEGDGVCKAHG